MYQISYLPLFYLIFFFVSKEDAKKQYIDLVTSLGGDLGSDSSKGKRETKAASSEASGKYKTIIVEKTGKVFKITFNRPDKKNALTPEVNNVTNLT